MAARDPVLRGAAVPASALRVRSTSGLGRCCGCGCRRRCGRRGRVGDACAELLRPQRRAAVALKGLVGQVADAELAVAGREDVLAMARRVQPGVHRLAWRAELAGAPGDVLAELVARCAPQVGGEDELERVSAGSVAELTAGE